MSADLLLRRMVASDLAAVMAIAASLSEAPHWSESAYLTAIDEGSIPKRIALAAEESATGRIAGFAVVTLLGPESELETIAVATQDQRLGIGSKLVAALSDELKIAEVRQFHLEVRASNQKALNFYRSRGWHETGRRIRYYADPEEDAVLMTLDLG